MIPPVLWSEHMDLVREMLRRGLHQEIGICLLALIEGNRKAGCSMSLEQTDEIATVIPLVTPEDARTDLEMYVAFALTDATPVRPIATIIHALAVELPATIPANWEAYDAESDGPDPRGMLGSELQRAMRLVLPGSPKSLLLVALEYKNAWVDWSSCLEQDIMDERNHYWHSCDEARARYTRAVDALRAFARKASAPS